MKRIRLIYNPQAGDTSFKNKLDIIVEKFQRVGYQLELFRSERPGDLHKGCDDIDHTHQAILIAGGDGSVNEVVNAALHRNINLPIGIFPAGTANDFAHHLNMPSDIAACCDVFLRNNLREVDVGLANDRYFINVASGGLLTSVSQNIDVKLKNTLGKLAYYIKGIEQLPSFKSFKMSFEYEDMYIEEQIYLFLVLNGNSAGGFDKLAKEASMNDGVFDVIAFKMCPLAQMATLFIKILRGEHFHDPNVIYFRTNELTIKQLDGEDLETDLDGERGPHLPMHITLLPRRIKFFTNR